MIGPPGPSGPGLPLVGGRHGGWLGGRWGDRLGGWRGGQHGGRHGGFAFIELSWGRSQIPNPVLKRLGKVAEIEVDKVADMVADMVANIMADVVSANEVDILHKWHIHQRYISTAWAKGVKDDVKQAQVRGWVVRWVQGPVGPGSGGSGSVGLGNRPRSRGPTGP